MGGGARAPASCGGGAHCAAAAVSQGREKEEEGGVEGYKRCPVPLFMGTVRVQLPFLLRAVNAADVRIVRARSARLRRLRPHDPPHRGPQGGNGPRRDRVRLMARKSRRHAAVKGTQVPMRLDGA